MMKTEYRVNADCMSATVTDMEDIMGLKTDIVHRRLEHLQNEEGRKQRYMNTLVMRMMVFLEPFEDEVRDEEARTIFDIMDKARSRRATNA